MPSVQPSRLRAIGLTGLLALGMLYLAFTYGRLTRILLALHFNDFGKFYYAVEQWRHGLSLYAPNEATLIPMSPSTAKQFLDLNPPHFHILIWPLAFVDPPKAFAIWMAVNLGMIVAAFVVIKREIALRVSPDGYVIGVLVAAALAPTMTWFVTGQVTGVLVALSTWMWVAMRRGRWTEAGLAVGVACAIKLFFAPFGLFLILRRRWSAVAAAACAGAACGVAGLLVFGGGAYAEWLVALRAVDWRWPLMNASIAAPLARATVNPLHPQAEPQFVNAIGTALSLLVLLIGIGAAVRASRIDDSVTVLLLTCLLASPLGWIYYHWIVLGPGLRTFRPAGPVVYAACALLLVPFFLLFPWSLALFAVTAASVYTWSTLALWCVALRRALREREPAQ